MERENPLCKVVFLKPHHAAVLATTYIYQVAYVYPHIFNDDDDDDVNDNITIIIFSLIKLKGNWKLKCPLWKWGKEKRQAETMNWLNQVASKSITGQGSKSSKINLKSNKDTSDPGFADKIKTDQQHLDRRSVASR